MAKEFIVDGAQCKCTCGSVPGIISVTDQIFSHSNGGKLCATTKTIGTKVIGTPFGTCNASFPSRSCLPNIVQWSNFFKKLKIGADSFPLTDESKGMCSLGGSIDFINTGQISIVGTEQMSTASAEFQGELDPVGNPMSLTEHQITAMSEISSEQTDTPQKGKILSAAWETSDGTSLKNISYKETAYIHIKTENIIGQIKIKVVDYQTGEKVEQWDEAKDKDFDFFIDITNNEGKKAFTPTDEWFSKRASNKEIYFEIYYNNENKNIPKHALKITKINYNKDMVISDNGIRFTAQEEALGMICPDGKIRPYKGTEDNWTIGYGEKTGTTANTVLDSKDVAFSRYKDKIKGEFLKEARRLLFKYGIKRKLEQYEFDAIVDLVYNSWSCGDFIGHIVDGEEITEHTFTNFKTNNGSLISRRKAEYMLYTNQLTSVSGSPELHRKDNTNGGYDKIFKEVPVTQKIKKNGKMIEELVFETIDGKQIPKMKTIQEQGWYQVNSKEKYTLIY